MSTNQELKINENNKVEDKPAFYGFVFRSPEDKLLEDINRSGLEKLQAFTRMLRRNATLKRGIVAKSNNKL